MHKILPSDSQQVDSIDKKLFILSDGMRTVKDIISVTSTNFAEQYGKRYIDERCKIFFLGMFSKNYAIAFRKPWQ
jgi:hypothetical protein